MSAEDFAQSERVDLALHRVLAVLSTRRNVAATCPDIDARHVHIWTGDRCSHGMTVFVLVDPAFGGASQLIATEPIPPEVK